MECTQCNVDSQAVPEKQTWRTGCRGQGDPRLRLRGDQGRPASFCAQSRKPTAWCGVRQDQSGLSSQQRDSLFLFLPFALFRPTLARAMSFTLLTNQMPLLDTRTRVKLISQLLVIQPSRRIQWPITVRRSLW